MPKHIIRAPGNGNTAYSGDLFSKNISLIDRDWPQRRKHYQNVRRDTGVDFPEEQLESMALRALKEVRSRGTRAKKRDADKRFTKELVRTFYRLARRERVNAHMVEKDLARRKTHAIEKLTQTPESQRTGQDYLDALLQLDSIQSEEGRLRERKKEIKRQQREAHRKNLEIVGK